MLAPISARRRDKRTSFKKLASYLTEETSLDTREKIRRGDVLLSDNLLTLDTAAEVMKATAAQNKLCGDPVYHYQICWHPGERPAQRQWEAAARKTIAALGFGEHQYLIVAHDDKKHFHVHIMLNRVHPETYRAHYAMRDMFTLDRCMRELEEDHDWIRSVGLYRWDAQAEKAVKNTREEMRQLSKAAERAKGHAAELEHYRDIESLHSYVKKQPARELKTLLSRECASWQDVHAVLGRHGLQIEKGERGGYVVRAVGMELRVKASDVFRWAFAGKQNRDTTERKLGPWQEPQATQAEPERKYRERTPRDPEKRTQQREAREQQRQELKAAFRAYRDQERQKLKAHTGVVREHRQAISDSLTAVKKEIRAQNIPWLMKRAQMSIAVATAIAEKRILNQATKKERLELRPKTYQEWVTLKAMDADKAAAAQLRGWRYQDQRNLR